MASSDATQRAVLAGLSCGIGLAAPVVMYAATLRFSSVNETVVAGAVPFAVGAVAGVGIYAASLGISEYRAQREERLFQPDAMAVPPISISIKASSRPPRFQLSSRMRLLTLRLLLLRLRRSSLPRHSFPA